MRILIIGAGAVGGYFGGRLAAAGADVTFALRPRTAALLRAEGLQVRSPRGDLHLAQPQILAEGAQDAFDLVLICTKLGDLEAALETAARHLAPAGLAAALQNGVDAESLLAERVGRERVMGAVAYIAATLERPGVILQTGEMARLVVGLLDGGQHPVLKAFLEAAAKADVEVEASPDIEAAIWRKFVFLAPFAGLTASYRSAIGPLRENAQAWQRFADMVAEAVTVAQARRVNLPDGTLAEVLDFAQGLPESMKASMLHDLEAGRPLELAWLTGAIPRLGEESGVATPVSAAVTDALTPFARGRV